VLIGCERFGKVRDAFLRRGHDAYSCDLVPDPNAPQGRHLVMDVFEAIDLLNPDLAIFFPDCTFVTGSGNHWCYPGKRRVKPGTIVGDARIAAKIQAINFVYRLYSCKVPKVAIENPIGVSSSAIRKPDQIIHPWQFGDDASKATCIWKRGLPDLVPTNELPGGRKARRANQTPSGQNRLGPSDERAMLRAETYPGIADAMAEQWGR